MKVEENEMVKKTSELNLPSGAEELIAVNNAIDPSSVIENSVVDNPKRPVKRLHQEARVNSIIHEWLTDMWLLTTGEEFDENLMANKKQSGRPLAIVCDGQMRLMESRPFAIDALRAVGIEMQ